MYEEPLRCLLAAPPAVREQAEEAGAEEEPSETGRRWVAPPLPRWRLVGLEQVPSSPVVRCWCSTAISAADRRTGAARYVIFSPADGGGFAAGRVVGPPADRGSITA